MTFPQDLFLFKPNTVWEHAGITCFTVRNPLGSLNGYCVLPAGHPFGSKSLQGEDVHLIDVHGGITYGPTESKSGDVIIGWDTCHYCDYSEFNPLGHRWTEATVINETNHLARQIVNYMEGESA